MAAVPANTYPLSASVPLPELCLPALTYSGPLYALHAIALRLVRCLSDYASALYAYVLLNCLCVHTVALLSAYRAYTLLFFLVAVFLCYVATSFLVGDALPRSPPGATMGALRRSVRHEGHE